MTTNLYSTVFYTLVCGLYSRVQCIPCLNPAQYKTSLEENGNSSFESAGKRLPLQQPIEGYHETVNRTMDRNVFRETID